MDDNREKQIKEFRITQSADKKPGTQPLHVVIMPTSISTGQQQKSLLDNGSEPMITYSSHFPVTQTKAKPVRLVLMPALSKTDQQLPCERITNQSERKILLLPHSVVKQGKNASLQSNLTDQSAKKVCVLTATKDHSVTSCNTTGAEDCIGTQDSTSDSHSVLQATHAKNEGQNTQKTDAENDLEATQSSQCYISQCGKSSTNLNERDFLSESQQCENMNTSKGSKLKEVYVSGGPDSRPGMVPPHLTVMTASPKEIDYRIKAFLSRKRAELDIQNVEEYCLHIGMNPNVCARVDATVHQHRKRKKRKFEFAPQPEEEAEGTQTMSKNARHEQLPLLVAHPILEERVSNVEEHLRLGKPVPKDIYSRLKRIEDRILKLEGISPEYTYDATVNLHPPRNLPKIKRRCTTDELDAKIAELQKKLEKKSDCTSQKEIVK